jgi:Putative zinc-finger
MGIRSLKMLNCRNIAEMATDYMERRLNLWERLQFRAHVLICGPCQLYLRQMDKMVQMLRKFPREAPPVATEKTLLDAFRRAHSEKKYLPHA